jgi:hypothetical protein
MRTPTVQGVQRGRTPAGGHWRRISGRIGGPRLAEAPYMAMVKMFGHTGGLSNDVLHKVVAATRPKRSVPGPTMFGPPSVSGVEEATEKLKRDGYVIFPDLLDETVCDRLRQLAETLPCEVRLRPDLDAAPFRSLPPDVSVGWFLEQDLASEPLIQQIAGDPGLLNLAQSYLGCQPVLSVLAMWWSRAAEATDRERIENAQQFHFDIDRVKWLKFFVYLTDVQSSTGPHVFVAGSHRRGAQPRQFLTGANSRRDDASVEERFGDRVVELTGPKGTVFAADTRALHKGKFPLVGERLVLQLEFSDSLLGAECKRIGPVELLDPQLQRASSALPSTYKRWILTPGRGRNSQDLQATKDPGVHSGRRGH